jgi:methylated-DNA-[protein]-cysteine S-methyltransferase
MPQINGSLHHLFSASFSNEFGWFRPVSDGKCLIRLDWNQTGWSDKEQSDDVSRETRSQLQAYFAGKLHCFNIPLGPVGKSKEGMYWLEVMKKIPYATVMTYAELARLSNKPGAARAAGSACASNPIPIIYPCHRVIKSDGKIGNYGGGSAENPSAPNNLARKASLIALEQHWVSEQPNCSYDQKIHY